MFSPSLPSQHSPRRSPILRNSLSGYTFRPGFRCPRFAKPNTWTLLLLASPLFALCWASSPVGLQSSPGGGRVS